MTIQTEIRITDPFPGNGVSTAFPFDFKIFHADDIRVLVTTDDATQILELTTDYSVTISDEDEDAGGTVTLVAPLAVGSDLLIVGDALDFLQETIFSRTGGFDPTVLNAVLDRVHILLLQLKNQADRALLVPFGEDGFEVPVPEEGMVLGFIEGKAVWVPNDATSATALLAAMQVIAEAVEADQITVAADKAIVAGYKTETLNYRNEAEDFADEAEFHALAAEAFMDGAVFDTTAEGVDPVDGVADGAPFLVPNIDGNLALWRNVAGVATAIGVPQFVVPSAASLAAAVTAVLTAAATVGIETGNANSRGAMGGIDPNGFTMRAALRYSVAQKALVANRVYSALRAAMAKTIDFIGHSQVQGSGVVAVGATINPRSGINGSPPRKLEYRLQSGFDPKWRVINRGQSAQKSHEIASRMGAIPINVTLTVGTVLAAAGAQACTCSPGANGPSAQRGTGVDIYDGFIGAQACRVTNTGAGANAGDVRYTVEQIGGTGNINVIPGTPFWVAPDPLDYAIKFIFATENDADSELELSVAMISAMVEKLPPDERRFVIFGDWPFVGSNPSREIGTAWHNNMLAKHAIFRQRYGADFFDIYRFLRGEFPYDGTVYPSVWQFTGESSAQGSNDWVTPGDWITRGILPRRWVSIHLGGADTSHLHQETNDVLMRAAIEFHMKPKGWLL